LKKGLYQHYKGKKYELLDTVTHSETEERLVLYRALYGEKGLCVRPYNMFFETVTINSKITPRFRYIGNEK